MKSNRHTPPVWLMGLSNCTVGFNVGIVFFVIPQLLAARHVPEARIAAITAAAMSSNFSAIIFVPMLDVRFSRRWYATFFAALTSTLVFIAVTNLPHHVVLEISLALAVATAGFSTSALGGWLATVCPPTRRTISAPGPILHSSAERESLRPWVAS